MVTLPPSIQCAEVDPRLRGLPLALFHFLLEHLDLRTFRPIKLYVIQSAMGRETTKGWKDMEKRTARRLLNVLVDTGYLERGEQEVDISGADGPNTYRLVWACPPRYAPTGAAMSPPRAS